jgi:hypothetical protein
MPCVVGQIQRSAHLLDWGIQELLKGFVMIKNSLYGNVYRSENSCGEDAGRQNRQHGKLDLSPRHRVPDDDLIAVNEPVARHPETLAAGSGGSQIAAYY